MPSVSVLMCIQGNFALIPFGTINIISYDRGKPICQQNYTVCLHNWFRSNIGKVPKTQVIEIQSLKWKVICVLCVKHDSTSDSRDNADMMAKDNIFYMRSPNPLNP